MKNGLYAFDIETFQNFFSTTFVSLHSDDAYAFVVHPDRDERYSLVDFLAETRGLVGFNSVYYDSPALRYFIQYHLSGDLNQMMYQLSKRLISADSYEDDEIRQLRFPKSSDWRDMDLMKMQAYDKLGIGLKQAAINLRWHRIQDLPLPYDAVVSEEQIPMVLDYNLNDVLITKALYQRLQPEINLRKEIKRVYGVDVINASDSKMANLLLEDMMNLENGELKELREQRTERESVRIADCIPHNLKFKSVELNLLLEKLKQITVSRYSGFKYKSSIRFAGVEYQLGIGGLHSEDAPGDFRSDEQSIIRDADVSSYYPAIMLNLNIRPEHLGEDFSRILRQMTDDRLAAKHAGDKIRADTLKITINSVFGKLGSDTFWLYDPKAFLQVTIAGQLYLLMLIEMLQNAGIQTISANTDGIICRVGKDKQEVYQQICQQWQQQTHFELEFSDYVRYVRRDVNSYVAIKPDGKTKEKGVFAKVTDLRKGFKYPIVQQCLYEYFVNGQSVDDTLKNNRDVLDYAISQKTGAQFKLEYHTLEGKTVLQKNNRFAISRKGGALVKRQRSTNKETRLYSGKATVLLNDLDVNLSFDTYQIDLDFYRKEVMEIIELIEPKIQQIALFA